MKNALAYYNAGVAVIKSELAGLAAVLAATVLQIKLEPVF
jgi:hypothetical protein